MIKHKDSLIKTFQKLFYPIGHDLDIYRTCSVSENARKLTKKPSWALLSYVGFSSNQFKVK